MLFIELLPVSYQDWDIVSSRPGVVEELLLRQMSLVEFGKLKLQLDGTMEVSFRVSMLEQHPIDKVLVTTTQRAE